LVWQQDSIVAINYIGRLNDKVIEIFMRGIVFLG